MHLQLFALFLSLYFCAGEENFSRQIDKKEIHSAGFNFIIDCSSQKFQLSNLSITLILKEFDCEIVFMENMQAEWRSSITGHGGLSVMISGPTLMHE